MLRKNISNWILTSPLRAGFLDLLTASFAIQFLGFGTLLLIPRFVTPAELGELKVIQSIVSLFAIFAGLGFNTAVLKLCSEDRTEIDKESILSHALRRTIVTSVIALVLVVLLTWTGILSVSSNVQNWLGVYALIIPFDAATNLFASYLQARQRIKELARAQLLVKVQAVLIVLAATWRFGFDGFVFATIVGYALGLTPFLRTIGLKALHTARTRLPPIFWSIASFSSLANGVNTLGRHADIFVLGLFYQDPVDLGFYALAKIFLSGATVVTGTAQRLALPRLSRLAENEVAFRSTVRTSQLQTALLSVAVATLVHFAAWIIIRTVYNVDYSMAMVYLDVLLLKYVIWSGFSVTGISSIAIGRPVYNLIGACITTPVALGLTYFFLSTGGTIGVAWAQVIGIGFTFVVVNGLYAFATRRHFRLSTSNGSDINL